MRILVVDDEAGVRDVLRRILVLQGHQVDCAPDVDHAVSLVEKQQYDISFVDYSMPGKDGLWFLANVVQPRKMQAVLMTAYGTMDLLDQALQMGAASCMLKPFAMAEILRNEEEHSAPKDGARPAYVP